MKNQFQDIEWIERYLDRSLTPDEKEWMEKRMVEEPHLKSRLKEHQQLVAGIRYTHLQNKLEQLRALENTLSAAEKKSVKNIFFNNYWKPLAIAAAMALFITSYLLIIQPPTTDELYAQYFNVYPNVFEPTVRGNDNIQDNRTIAFRAYDQGDYAKAASLFNQLIQQKEEAGMLLLLGNANLILGKTEEAQNNFLTLIKDFDELDGQAKLYLGLSYLKQGKKEKAKLILQELEEPEVTYSKKAKELLDNLK